LINRNLNVKKEGERKSPPSFFKTIKSLLDNKPDLQTELQGDDKNECI